MTEEFRCNFDAGFYFTFLTFQSMVLCFNKLGQYDSPEILYLINTN